VIAEGNIDLGSNRANGKTFTFTIEASTMETPGR
jgi:hypothetical protein